MTLSKTKVRRAATRGLSVGLTATTSLWLAGSSMFLAVPAAHASNDAVVSDITSSNPRIAPNGESELAVLGINIIMDANDANNNKQLQSFVVQFKSDDGAGGGEAALANLETARLYSDSGLSGTGGQFDSQDALVDTVTQTCVAAEAGGGDCDATKAVTSTAGANVAAGATSIDITDTGNAYEAGAILKLGAGVTAERVIVLTAVVDDDAIDNACTAAVGAADLDCITIAATTFAHPTGDAVRELNLFSPIANSVDEGFVDFAAAPCAGCHAGYEGAVIFGDTVGDANADVLAYTPPVTDAGNDAGNDLFLAFLTQGGVANQSFVAAIWPEVNSRIQLNDIDATPVRDIPVNSNNTNNESKTVTFGADGVAPTIQSVSTFDNDADGAVDRVEVKFSESMGTTVTAAANFKDAVGGDAEQINSLDASDDDIDLATNGTWMTGTVLNDTLRIDFEGDAENPANGETAAEYEGATQSTGDTWTAIYDEDNTGDLADATGQELLDQSLATTDKARPVLLAAQVRDTDNDSKVDQLRVTGSETWGGTSTSSGLTLRNTTNVPSTIYSLGAISSYATSGAAAPANANDIAIISVTEASSNDVGNTFTLDYTAASTLVDSSAAANEARSLTGLAVTSGAEPIITRIQTRDLDTDGQVDGLLLTFNQIPTVDLEWAALFTVSGFAIAGEDADESGAVDGADTNNDGDVTLQLILTESGVADTDVKPDVTAVASDAAGANQLCVSVNADCDDAADVQMTALTAPEVVEEDGAAPEMTSLIHYGDTDGIWENNETVQALFSEPIDPGSIAGSWQNDDLIDFTEPAPLTDLPDTGLVSVSGRVVTLTATINATTALTDGADEFNPVANEIKDFAVPANSAADAVNTPLDTTPTTAPAVALIRTADRNNNGVLDALQVEFDGMIAANSIVAANFIAAKGSNYTVVGDPPVATSTQARVAADLTVTSVVTSNGGNDSRLFINFNEAGEDTSRFPQGSYLQGSLKDLAGNSVASFNRDGTDSTMLSNGPANDSRDRALPLALAKILRDRNGNSKIDQVRLIFSEGIDDDVVNGDANVNAVHVSDGLMVAGKVIAANGNLENNLDYQNYTFATTNAQFSLDVTEGASVDSSLPGVSYVSSGQFRDAYGNLMASFNAGGEISEFGVMAPPPPPPSSVVDGDLIRASGYIEVWVVKHVGAKQFRRHVLSDQMGNWYPHLSPFWSHVEVVDVSVVNQHTMSAWVRLFGDTKVYEINDDRSAHHITCNDDSVAGQDCANEWVAAGGDGDGIYTINSAEWGYYIVANPVVLPDQPN